MKTINITSACEIQVGKTPSRSNPSYWGEGSRWLSIADMNQGQWLLNTKETITEKAVKECNCKIIPENTVLFSFKLSIGKVGITKVPMYTNEAIAAFLIKDSFELETKFLYYALNGVDHSIGSNKAVMGRTLNKEQLKRINIPLPPLNEQKRIVRILDKANALRKKRKQAIELLDDYLKSVFLEMFGDPVKNTKGWDRVPLSKILLKIESGRSPVCLDRIAMPGEWGVLKLGAVTKCIYNSAENKALPDTDKPNPDIEVKAGDILFSRKNTYELVAACAYVWKTPSKLMMSDLIFRLLPRNKNSINSIFLQALLSFSSKRKMIQRLAGGAAGSMPNISKAKLLEHKIEVPPFPLQNKFAEIVEKTELLKQKMLVQSEELETQFQSLMQKAAKGDL